MNVVDSSAWIEYFSNSPEAEHFASVIEDTENLLVPTLVLFEVYKYIARTRDEQDAEQALGAMYQGKLVDVDAAIAIDAARLSLLHQLPMADSVILAACRASGATLWTQDAHFEGLPEVCYFGKR